MTRKGRYHQPRQITRTRDGGLGFKFWAPERVIERQTGCYNCIHFDNGEKAQKYFDDIKVPEVKVVMMEKAMNGGATALEAAEKVQEFLQKQVYPMRPPKSGICIIGKSGTDFVHHAYKCSSWTGRIRPDGPGDELVSDIKAKMGEEQ